MTAILIMREIDYPFRISRHSCLISHPRYFWWDSRENNDEHYMRIIYGHYSKSYSIIIIIMLKAGFGFFDLHFAIFINLRIFIHIFVHIEKFYSWHLRNTSWYSRSRLFFFSSLNIILIRMKILRVTKKFEVIT